MSENSNPTADLTPEQITMDMVLRAQHAGLSAVAGTMAAKITEATAELSANGGEFGPVNVYNNNKQVLAELKATVAENKIAAETAIREFISAHNTGPSAAEIRASKAAIISTMRLVGLDPSDLETPVSLTGVVMGATGAPSPFYYVKKNGERSYRQVSALAANPFGVKTDVLAVRLAEIASDNTDDITGNVGSWERTVTIGQKSATVGFTAPIVSDDDDDDDDDDESDAS